MYIHIHTLHMHEYMKTHTYIHTYTYLVGNHTIDVHRNFCCDNFLSNHFVGLKNDFVYIHRHLYVCMYVSAITSWGSRMILSTYTGTCRYTCVYVCMYVCMYIFMYVCTTCKYIWACICKCQAIFRQTTYRRYIDRQTDRQTDRWYIDRQTDDI